MNYDRIVRVEKLHSFRDLHKLRERQIVTMCRMSIILKLKDAYQFRAVNLGISFQVLHHVTVMHPRRNQVVCSGIMQLHRPYERMDIRMSETFPHFHFSFSSLSGVKQTLSINFSNRMEELSGPYPCCCGARNIGKRALHGDLELAKKEALPTLAKAS